MTSPSPSAPPGSSIPDATPPAEQVTGAVPGVICPAVLDLAHAPELKEQLLSVLAGGSDVVVDAAQVTQADTACLQLLCAAAVSLARTGRSLSIVAPSPALTRVAERLGLARTLGLKRLEVPSAGPAPRGSSEGT